MSDESKSEERAPPQARDMSSENQEKEGAKGQAHDNVLRRRKYHIAYAKWLARWSYPLQGLFAAIGFFIVLLPALSNSWRTQVEAFFISGWIYHEFSTFGATSLTLLICITAPLIFQSWALKNYPGGWDPREKGAFPNPKQVVKLGLYPRTAKEEIVFWIEQIHGTIGTSLWLYLPFAGLAYAIR